MTVLLALVFVLGYLGVVFEHKIKVDKSASALLTGAIIWTLYALSGTDLRIVEESLHEHIAEIAGILFFLMGAMTIVELVDTYDGFEIITDHIHTTSETKLLWIIGFLAFFLSAILDNLTTTIVMVTLSKKLISNDQKRLFFVGLIVVAANAGGVWSPMGDVTTTMLWIGGQITASHIVKALFFPSLVSMVIPFFIISLGLKGGNLEKPKQRKYVSDYTSLEKAIIFYTGIVGLLLVPVLKTVTHLPPFMGMLFSLGVVWLISEILVKDKDEELKRRFSVNKVLQKIDMPSILFFLGILLAVSALQSTGVLVAAAQWLTLVLKNETVIVTVIGLLSAVVDNVPLVAAVMGMFSLDQFPSNSSFWELLAYCAGTGGSALIIGSAAGVAAMGIEKIEFFWYFRRISWLALIGYFSGIGVFLLQKIF